METKNNVSEVLWARRRDDAIDERRKAHEMFALRIDLARKDLDNALSRVDKKETDLGTRKGDVVVLERHTPGARLTVYHSAYGPCGRVVHRSNFTQKFETEVAPRRIKRCSACIWPN